MVRFMPSAASFMSCLPTGIEPVNEIARMIGEASRYAETSAGTPNTTDKTPAGRPASASARATSSADPGAVLEVTLSGCAFHATTNVVRVGDATLRDVASNAGGTRIHVVVPKEIRGASGPPMQIAAGTYEVTVNNGRGTSNVVHITLR